MNKNIYFAPLQSYTTPFFRKAFNKTYNNIDKYFTPFFEIQKTKIYTSSLSSELSPAYGQPDNLIPQILTNNSKFLIQFCNDIKALGYQEINLNIGCPHPPVVNKNLGSGILTHPVIFEQLLEQFFTEFTDIKLSVKMRLGITNNQEWSDIINISNRYPLEEIIIHPRTAKQQYKGHPDWNQFNEITKNTDHKIVGNGDITTISDMDNLTARFTNINSWMIGRGLLSRPWLINEIRQININPKTQLKTFHDYYFMLVSENVHDINVKRNLTIDFWKYLSDSFENGKRHFRKLTKQKHVKNYSDWADIMFGFSLITGQDII